MCILCITKEKEKKEWMNFEAGIIINHLKNENVVPYLIDVDSGDLNGPISHFQALTCNEKDTFELLLKLNKELPDSEKRGVDKLKESFDRNWPRFSKYIEWVINSDSAFPPLTSFPEAFYPLTIVFGDERDEYNPKRKYDLLTGNLSPIDILFYASLKLHPDTELLSDKKFLDKGKNEPRLRENNLLCISGPVANQFARFLSPYMLHRFNISNEMREFDRIFRESRVLDACAKEFNQLIAPKQFNTDTEEIKKELDSKDYNALIKIKESLLDILHDDIKEMAMAGKARLPELNPFRQVDHIVDIINNEITKFRKKDRIFHFGFISMGINPYNENRLAIHVAGQHEISTGRALKCLENPDFFKHHPYGGILEIKGKEDDDFFSALKDTKANWYTENKTYTIEEAKESLKKMTCSKNFTKDYQKLYEMGITQKDIKNIYSVIKQS